MNEFTLPGITVIEGDLGAGKTLASVIMALHYHRTLGKQIYSNFEIKNVDYKPIRCLADLEKVRHGLLILDEAYTVSRAREFMTNRNKAINTLIQRSRKKDFHVIDITQRFHMIDKDLRYLTNRIISPKIIEHATPSPKSAPTKMILRIRKPIYPDIDSPPKWVKKWKSTITINPYVLTCYDTSADIFDYNIDKFEADLKKGRDFEIYIYNLLTERGYDTILHSGRNQDHPGFYDLTVIEPKYAKIDCVGSNATRLYTNRKTLDKMINDTQLIFLDRYFANNGGKVLRTLDITDENRRVLCNAGDATLNRVRPYTKSFDETYPKRN